MSAKRFRIAFSFAGEKRDYVESVAKILAGRFSEDEILYDRFHEAEFARARLGRYLPKLYHENSDLVVVVICRDYAQKEWPGLEWDAIFDLLKKRREDEVMLGRFDGATVEGLYSDAGFVELDHKTPERAATLILERLALNEGLPKDYYKTDSKDVSERQRTSIPNNLPRLQYFFGREAELKKTATPSRRMRAAGARSSMAPGASARPPSLFAPPSRCRAGAFVASSFFRQRNASLPLMASGRSATSWCRPIWRCSMPSPASWGKRTFRNRRKVNAPSSSCASSVMPTYSRAR